VTKRERLVDVDFGELYKARQALIQARLACDQAIAVLNRLAVTEPRRGSVVGIETSAPWPTSSPACERKPTEC
jgi:hypothetical protein